VRLVCRIVVAVTLQGLFALPGCKEQNHFAPPPPPRVAVAVPVQRTVPLYLEVSGTVAAANSVDLMARVEGFLQDISYTDGDEVKKGQILFTIEPQSYQAKLQQAQAAEAGAQAQLSQTDAEYRRQAQLGRTDASSQSTVDQALMQRDTAKASVQQAQANTVLSAIDYSYTRVMAPFDGIATAHLVSVGTLVGSGTPTKLASVVQLDPVYVNFNVTEQDVLRIRGELARRGLTIRDVGKVQVEVGLQNERGYPHVGTLDYVAPGIDQSTGTLPARAVFSNAKRALIPGFFARVRVPVQPPRPELMVPDIALGSDQRGRYVLVVDGNDMVEQRRIVTGPAVDELRIIESGLTQQDRVVVSGLQRAIPGQKVSPQPAAIE
jgi:RND family efflux transporter MFP subunit